MKETRQKTETLPQQEVFTDADTPAMRAWACIARAETLARADVDEGERVRVLREGMMVARTILDDVNRSRTFAALANWMPVCDRGPALREALAAARSVIDENYRAQLIELLVPDLEDMIDAFAQRSGKHEGIGESKWPQYNLLPMGDAAHDLNALAADLDLPLEVATEALKQAKAELTARETTTRATATPRLKWESDRDPDENPAAFAWRAYADEAKAGTLHLGVIRQEDEPLAVKLVSWLRSPANRKQVPEGFDIPTKPEWNSRQLAKLDDAPTREVKRLLRVERGRAERARAGQPTLA